MNFIKSPRTDEEWEAVVEETTVNGVGAGNLLNTVVPVKVFPDKILTQKSELVSDDEFGTTELATLTELMFSTMKHNRGIGLSAVQIGHLKRIITMKVPLTEKVGEKEQDVSRPFIFINPVLLQNNEELYTTSEGCLSVPGYYVDRKRPSRITLKFRTLHGNEVTTEFEGLEAFCIQHEMDHLDGKLFIDDLSELKKDRIKKLIKKTQKRQ